jgi:hypothetical protein
MRKGKVLVVIVNARVWFVPQQKFECTARWNKCIVVLGGYVKN